MDITLLIVIITVILLVVLLTKKDENKPENKKFIILFDIAMFSEFKSLFDKYTSYYKEQICENNLYTINYKNKTIYVLHSHIGMINKTISLTKLLQKIRPDVDVKAGTSGDHDINLNVGDIVLGKDVINLNLAKTPRRDICDGKNSLELEFRTFTEDESLMKEWWY